MKKGLLLFLCLLPLLIAHNAFAEGGKMNTHREVLDSGMILLVTENHELPVVHFRLRLPAGTNRESADKSGLASITSSMLMRGCAGYDADELADAFDSLGARASFSVEYDYCDGTLSLLKEDMDEGLELMSRVLLQPSFDEKQFEQLKGQFLSSILRRAENPGELARQKFLDLLWPNHPYGRPQGGVKSTMEALTIADVREFHRMNYLPGGSILSVAGDITPAEAKRAVSKHLKDWSGTAATVHSPLTPGPVKGRTIVILDKDQPQANIYFGHLGVERGDEAYYTLRTLNYILGGGGFVSRLTDRIRTRGGLAYSAYSSSMSFREGGVWLASVGTRSDATGQVVEMILDEIERIRTEPVSESELSDTLGYYLGSLPLALETGEQLAGLAISIEFHDLGWDYLDRYADLVTAVSPELLQSTAARYISDSDWVLVVAGPADEIKPQLEQFGSVEVLPLVAED